MDQIFLNLTDVISVRRASNSLEPLNLVFYKPNLDNASQRVLRGPGLYVISFKSEVIYVGKYRPNGPNILDDRWIRHLETITLRGARVGFSGQRNPRQKLESLLQQVSNPFLKGSLQIDPARIIGA
jgi:hypothetical protein